MSLVVGFAADGGARAQTESILHVFDNQTVANDGQNPSAPLVQGPDGNFYGVTQFGGSFFSGTVFKITPAGQETILHRFGPTSPTYDADGEYPLAALTLGRDGFLYGSTSYSPLGNTSTVPGGVIFKISTQGAFTPLHDFFDSSVPNDGQDPEAALVEGSDGNFYGTTRQGGSANEGAVFEMTPAGQLTILHSFGDGSVPSDGQDPDASLIQGSDGNFYGTTANGGSAGLGTVFDITPSGQETILHSFLGPNVGGDGWTPEAALVEGPDGNFYGTTANGGVDGAGIIFKITSAGQESVFHTFGVRTADDGDDSDSPLIVGGDGNLYGATPRGGSNNSGNIFRVTLSGQVTVLCSFLTGSVPDDGSWPTGIIQASNGLLYGTTYTGGAFSEGQGTFFSLNAGLPAPLPTVTGFTPASGLVGSAVTIEGADLIGTTAIAFDGVASKSFTIVSENVATAVVPAGASTGPISVTNGGGTVVSASDFTPQYLNFFSASAATVTGGSKIAFTVKLAGAAPAGGEPISVQSSSVAIPSTQFTVPAGSATATVEVATAPVDADTPVNLTATSNGATGTASVTVDAAKLSKLALSPNPVDGGKAVTATITLSGAAGPSGTTVALSSSDGTTIPAGASAVVAPGATTGTYAFTPAVVTSPVAVTITANLGAASPSVVLTVDPGGVKPPPAPTIVSFTPVSGPVGTIVAITGTNLTTTSSVSVNRAPAAFTVVSATSISATVPAGATSGPISLLTEGGPATSTTGFTVTASPPSISGFTPGSGPVGTVVTIAGQNLVGASVAFNGTTATPTTDTSTQIVVVVPQGATTGPITVTTPGGTATSASAFDISDLVSFSLAPPVVVGGGYVNVTVVLSAPAPAGGVSVVVQSDDGTVQPGQVTIPAGSTTGTGSFLTSGVDVDMPVTLTASAGNSKSATVTVDAATLRSLRIAKDPAYGGNIDRADIFLNGAAGPSGVNIALSSSDGTTIPPGTIATVPPGAIDSAFPFTPAPVTSPVTITITATDGSITKSGVLTIETAALTKLAAAASVDGGDPLAVVATLSAPAPPGGVSVALTSSSPAVDSGTIFVPAGATTGTLMATTNGVDSDTPVTVTATLGSISESAVVTVDAAGLSSMEATPPVVFGGSTAAVLVSLSAAAGPSGVVVGLSSSDGTTVPPGTTVTIPADSFSALASFPTALVSSSTTVTISAMLGATTKTTALTIKPRASP